MSTKAGKKRASPGADVEKNPLAAIDLNEEDAKKLDEVQQHLQRVELILERRAQDKLQEVYERRRDVVKTISKFWPIALTNHSLLAFHMQHTGDQYALSHLEDLWVVRDPVESRCYTVEFHFKENPFFSDKVLKKVYKYIPPAAAADETQDEDGLTPSALDFSWERDVEPSAIQINWSNSEKNLTKLYPRVNDLDEGDPPSDNGSFFNWFEHKDDPFEIGNVIVNEVFPEATDYYLGTVSQDELDEDDEDEDDSDDNAEEIDLEKPRSKKQKKA